MKLGSKIQGVITFTEEELGMLQKVSKIKFEACDKYVCCDCPFNDTYLCHPRFDLRTHERTRRIVYMRNKGDVQK